MSVSFALFAALLLPQDDIGRLGVSLVDGLGDNARVQLQAHGPLKPDEQGSMFLAALLDRSKNGVFKNRSDEMVKLLFEFGADPDTKNSNGYSAFLYCVQNRNISVPALKTLLTRVDNVNATMPTHDRIHILHRNGNAITLHMEQFASKVTSRYEVTQCLLEAGVNPNVPKVIRPPILVTAYVGQLDVFKLLLKYKANPRVLNATGQSLFHIVTLRKTPGNLQILEYSLKNKLAPTDVLFQGETPYATAKRKGNKEAVKLFEKYGVNK